MPLDAAIEETVQIDPLDGTPLTEAELLEFEGRPTGAEQPGLDYVNYLSGIMPLISTPACGNRSDYYRWKRPDGGTICFASAGTIKFGTTTSVQKICPGANRGRTLYKFEGTNYWSLWRGPETNHNVCYNFTTPVKAYGVTISK